MGSYNCIGFQSPHAYIRHQKTHHDLTWRLVTRRREISLKTLRRGKKAAQTKGSQDTTQGNQPETLRRGKKAAQTKGSQDTTQGNQPET